MSFTKSCGPVRLILFTLFALVLSFAFSAGAWAKYPDRDIRVIIAYKPGGGSDIRARLVGKIIKDNNFLPQPWVVTNIPGGGAAIGQKTVLKAKPDGYTILVHHGHMITGNLLGLFNWTYTDFSPVAQITENPLLICTHKKTPYKTFKDVLKAAKKNPGTITWAWGGMGGHTHFASEAIFGATKAKMRPLALAGAAEQKAALAGGQMDVAIMGVIPMEYIKSGDFVPLAVTSDKRIPQLPNVPTLKEEGVDLSISMRYSVFAPPKTPEAVLNILREALRKATSTDEYKKKIEAMGAVVKFRPGKDMTEQYSKDYVVFKSVAAKIKEARKKK